MKWKGISLFGNQIRAVQTRPVLLSLSHPNRKFRQKSPKVLFWSETSARHWTERSVGMLLIALLLTVDEIETKYQCLVRKMNRLNTQTLETGQSHGVIPGMNGRTVPGEESCQQQHCHCSSMFSSTWEALSVWPLCKGLKIRKEKKEYSWTYFSCKVYCQSTSQTRWVQESSLVQCYSTEKEQK